MSNSASKKSHACDELARGINALIWCRYPDWRVNTRVPCRIDLTCVLQPLWVKGSKTVLTRAHKYLFTVPLGGEAWGSIQGNYLSSDCLLHGESAAYGSS